MAPLQLDLSLLPGARTIGGMRSETTVASVVSDRKHPSPTRVTTLQFARVGVVMLLVHDHRSPSREDWSVWVDAFANAVDEHGVRALLVVSQGGGPNARQRKEVIEALAMHLGAAVDEMATAVCGSSTTVRAITAAIGWLSGAPRMRSFASDARNRALEYLNVPKEKQAQVLLVAKRLEAELRDKSRNSPQ